MPTRCTAATRAQIPCKAWAVQGTDPPRCAAHGGVTTPGGAPKGNANARKHGVYASPLRAGGKPHSDGAGGAATLPERVDDLDHRIQQLSDYIDANSLDFDPETYLKFLDLYSKMIARLGRLRRMSQLMKGDANAEIAEAINEALDELALEWGTDL